MCSISKIVSSRNRGVCVLEIIKNYTLIIQYNIHILYNSLYTTTNT